MHLCDPLLKLLRGPGCHSSPDLIREVFIDWQVDPLANHVLTALEKLLLDLHRGNFGSEAFEQHMRVAVLCRHYLLSQGIGPVSVVHRSGASFAGRLTEVKWCSNGLCKTGP